MRYVLIFMLFAVVGCNRTERAIELASKLCAAEGGIIDTLDYNPDTNKVTVTCKPEKRGCHD